MDTEQHRDLRIEIASDSATGTQAMVYEVFTGGKKQTRIKWDDDLSARVITLWREGHTASEIAALIGVPDMRSAVIGRIHRLGQARRAPPNILKMPKAAYARKRKPGLNIRLPTVAEKQKAALVHDAVLADMEKRRDVARIKFADLETHHCRYPIGHPNDPAFGYCGEQAVTGKPYCHAHATRCYQPELPRQEK